MKWTQNHHSRVIMQHQETVALISTAESKRVFKSQTALKWSRTNVQCNLCFYLIWCIYIYIYIYILNTLSGGKSFLVAPGVAVPPWATETVLSPWLAADEGRVSHVLSHVVWLYIYIYNFSFLLVLRGKKKEYFNIYIYIYIYICIYIYIYLPTSAQEQDVTTSFSGPVG